MLMNATANGNSITKSGGCGGCADSSAVSQQQIGPDGYVEFTASETGSLRVLGLGDSQTDPAGLLFSIRLQGSTAEVREGDVYKSETAFEAGDVLRISLASGVVTYSRNGRVFFTSSGTASPLFVGVVLYDLHASIANIVVATTSSPALKARAAVRR